MYESNLLEAKASYAENSIKKLQEEKIEPPLEMTGREKAIFWMGVNQGLETANQLLMVTKQTCKIDLRQ
jgi:hypothetical protein